MSNNLVRENNRRAASRGEGEKFITPPTSVSETTDGYLLELEMPGVSKDGLEIRSRITNSDNRSSPNPAIDGTPVIANPSHTIIAVRLRSIPRSTARKSPRA